VNILLSGIVGSVAYGLATPESDVDRLGIFAEPTRNLLTLAPAKQSHVSHEPDITHHEAGKVLYLALRCNPSITELLWLPEYEVRTEAGEFLLGIRESLLSATMVRNAYLGYATQQFERIQGRILSPDAVKKTEKHARHLLRLLTQGTDLYTTGHLTVKLEDPERYREFGRIVAAGSLAAARKEIELAEGRFDTATSPLPGSPDEEVAGEWLQRVREYYWDYQDVPQEIYVPFPGMPKAVIVDIDGTVAIRGAWRQDVRSPYDMTRVGEDYPNIPVIEAVREAQAQGILVIFVSARKEAARRITEIWLNVHFGPYEALHMRADGDNRADVIVKKEIFDTYIRPYYHVLRAYDDRDQTVAGWRQLGLPCFQVAPGSF
jgi:RNA repair pathway DNA polymerase beta family